MINVETIQKTTKDNLDTAMKGFGTFSKGLQAIAVEVADYSKRNFEQSSQLVEKLLGARTLDRAVEIQSDYVKSAYEGYVAEMTKLGEMYVDLAKEATKPFEGAFARAANGLTAPAK